MRGIFIPSPSIVIIEPLATAEHYFPNIKSYLKACINIKNNIINFCESYEYHLGIMKVYYNARNKFVIAGKYTFKSIHRKDTIR